MVSQSTPSSQYRWLQQDALVVAPTLLGWELVTQIDGRETAGRIVEVEAYRGADDPASHAFRGITGRTAPMFLVGGYVYTYRSYGIHICMNIVTGPAGQASAVLIRALEPTVGLQTMSERRGRPTVRLLTSGPGRLTQALGITLADSGTQLGQGISLRPPRTPIDPATILASPRIGISSAKHQLWRFRLAQNQFVSKPWM